MKKLKDRWKFYIDMTNEWRWKRIAPNERVVGASPQGYVTKNSCIENARRNGYFERDREACTNV